MPWSAKSVANYLLDLADADGMTIDPLQMQKLVYFCEGWHLALVGTSLVREQFEAWKRGPVVPALYHSLKHFGFQPVSGRVQHFDPQASRVMEVDRPSDNVSRDLVKEVWSVYKRYTGPQLVGLTHLPGSPWDVTWKHANGAPDARIDKGRIKEWFEGEAERARGRNSRADT